MWVAVADTSSIIFVHGLRGHPQHTWEDSRDRDNQDKGTATRRKRHFFTAIFKSRSSSSASIDSIKSEAHPNKLFWPNEYLTQDIPEARVWTYGYNADAIGGLFKANNKNSVSQHGQDFAVRVEREIPNEVGTLNGSGGRLTLTITGPDHICGAQPRRHYRQRCTSGLLNTYSSGYLCWAIGNTPIGYVSYTNETDYLPWNASSRERVCGVGRDRIEFGSPSTTRLEQKDHQHTRGEQRGLGQHPRGVQDHCQQVSNSDPLVPRGTGNIRYKGLAQQGTFPSYLEHPLEY
jgi:hypothetical protein